MLAPNQGSQGTGQNVMDNIEYAELSARQMLAASNGDQNPELDNQCRRTSEEKIS